METIKCRSCGNGYTDNLKVCPFCDTPTPVNLQNTEGSIAPQYYPMYPQYPQYPPYPPFQQYPNQYPPPYAPYPPQYPPVYPPVYPPRKLHPRGRKMILVAGILLTCSGGLSLLSVLNSLAVTNATTELFNILGMNVPIVFLNIWSIITAVAVLFFGITGIKWSGRVEMGHSIIVSGIILIGFQIVGMIINGFVYSQMFSTDAIGSMYSLFGGTSFMTDSLADAMTTFTYDLIRVSVIVGVVIGAIIGCILPILYIVGGSRLKKSASKQSEETE